MYNNLTGFKTVEEMYHSDEIVESKFDSFEDEMDYLDDCRAFAGDKYFKIVNDSINNGEFIYHLLVLRVCHEFDIKMDCCMPQCIYGIVNYYLDNEIIMDFDKWLMSDNGPLFANEREFFKIFPEFENMSLHKAINIANQIYDLNLQAYDDYYVYSFEFNYDIKHIDIKIIQELKHELEFCKKYDVNLCEDSSNKLLSLGVDEETLNEIFNIV